MNGWNFEVRVKGEITDVPAAGICNEAKEN